MKLPFRPKRGEALALTPLQSEEKVKADPLPDLAARWGALLADTILSDAGGHGVSLEGTLVAEMSGLVEQDTVSRSGVFDVLAKYRSGEANRLLDFGCGQGAYRQALEADGWDWTGVDYLPGVAPFAADAVAAQSGDPKVFFYDGTTLPFHDRRFDIIFSMLVFEHIQHVDLTFAEICRVLKPGGRLVGMVSYLEPTHDFSTFNFTPIGLKVASERNGLALRRVYPAYDVFHFLALRLAQTVQHPDADSLGRAFNDPGNPFHTSLSRYGEGRGLTVPQRNLLALQFSAFVTFDIERPIGGQ